MEVGDGVSLPQVTCFIVLSTKRFDPKRRALIKISPVCGA